jgi:hypothetical protein
VRETGRFDKVSAVIINWNGECFFGQCIAAMMNETVKSQQIILVDNSSSDRSVEIVRKFPAVQLAQSFREDDGRVKKRTVATLGRVDQLSVELDSVIDGLLKVAGPEPAKLAPTISASSLTFESSRALGNVWTLTEIWKELGFSDLRRVFGRTRQTIDVEGSSRRAVCWVGCRQCL